MSIYVTPENDSKIQPLGKTITINNFLEVNSSQLLLLTITESIFYNFEIFYGKLIVYNSQQFNERDRQGSFDVNSIDIKIRYPGRRDEEYQEREYKLEVFKSAKAKFERGRQYEEYMVEDIVQPHFLIEFWQVPDYAYKMLSKTMTQHQFKEQSYSDMIKTIQKDILEVEPDEDISELKNIIPEEEVVVIPSGIPIVQFLEWVRKRQFPQQQNEYQYPIYFINNGKLYFKFINFFKEKRDIYLGSYLQQIHNYNDYVELAKESYNKISQGNFIYINRNRSVPLNQSISRHLPKLFHGDGDIPVTLIPIQFMNKYLSDPFYKSDLKDMYEEWYQFDQYFLDDPYMLEDRAGFIYSTLTQGYIQNQNSIQFSTSNVQDMRILEDINISQMVTLHISDPVFTGQITKKDKKEVNIQQIISDRSHIIYPAGSIWIITVNATIDSSFVSVNKSLEENPNPINIDSVERDGSPSERPVSFPWPYEGK